MLLKVGNDKDENVENYKGEKVENEDENVENEEERVENDKEKDVENEEDNVKNNEEEKAENKEGNVENEEKIVKLTKKRALKWKKKSMPKMMEKRKTKICFISVKKIFILQRQSVKKNINKFWLEECQEISFPKRYKADCETIQAKLCSDAIDNGLEKYVEDPRDN